MVQWASDNGAKLDEATIAAAAYNGHLELIKWLKANGCPWGTSTSRIAAVRGKLETLQWLIENSCPLDLHTSSDQNPKNKISSEKLANNKRWDILHYLKNYGLYLSTKCYKYALGDFEQMELLYLDGCPLSAKQWAHAIWRFYSIPLLEWLKSKNCPWDPKVVFKHKYNSVEGPRMAFEWILKNNFELDTRGCALVAATGDLKMLKWMRANGWPWDNITCEQAAYHGRLEVFKYAVEAGCPVDLKKCFTIYANIQEYIKQLK